MSKFETDRDTGDEDSRDAPTRSTLGREAEQVLAEMEAQDRFGISPRASKIGEWAKRLRVALGRASLFDAEERARLAWKEVLASVSTPPTDPSHPSMVDIQQALIAEGVFVSFGYVDGRLKAYVSPIPAKDKE